MQVIEDISPYLDKIKKIATFQYLTDDQFQKIQPSFEIIIYEEGEPIISQGEISQHLFAVIDGRVHVSYKEAGDKEILICDIHEGEVFGEAGIFMSEKRMANVIGAVKTIALRIPRREMISFIRQEPHAGNKILMLIIYSLLNKLRIANEELAFEKQSEINMAYMDNIIRDFMNES